MDVCDARGAMHFHGQEPWALCQQHFCSSGRATTRRRSLISNELTKYMCNPTSVHTISFLLALLGTLISAHDGPANTRKQGTRAQPQAREPGQRACHYGLATHCADAFARHRATDTVSYTIRQCLTDKVVAQTGTNRHVVGVIELIVCFAADKANHTG